MGGGRVGVGLFTARQNLQSVVDVNYLCNEWIVPLHMYIHIIMSPKALNSQCLMLKTVMQYVQTGPNCGKLSFRHGTFVQSTVLESMKVTFP